MKTKLLAELVKHHKQVMHDVYCILEMKRTKHPQLITSIKEKHEDYYLGQAQMMNCVLEAALLQANEYKGFAYIHFHCGEPVRCSAHAVQNNEPEYQEWCRVYHYD